MHAAQIEQLAIPAKANPAVPVLCRSQNRQLVRGGKL